MDTNILNETLSGMGQMVVILAGVVALGYGVFKLHRMWDQRKNLHTVKTLGAIKEEGSDFVAFTIDKVLSPGVLTPEDGTPLFRVAIEGRPWLPEDKGTPGVGFLFESYEDAHAAIITYLTGCGFTRFADHTDL